MRRPLLPIVLVLLVPVFPACKKNVTGPQIAPSSSNRGAVKVMPLDGDGVAFSPEEQKTLIQYLGNRLAEKGHFQVIPADAEREMLFQEKAKAASSMRNDDQTKVLIDKEKAARTAVTTTVGKVGDQCLVTSAMTDLESSIKIQTASAKGPCEQKALLQVLEYIGDRLSGLPAREPVFAEAAPRPSDRAVPYSGQIERPQTVTTKASTHQPAFSARYYTIGGTVGPNGSGVHVLGLQSIFNFRIGDHLTLGPLGRLGFVGDGTSLVDLGLHLGATYSLLSWLDVNWRATGGYTAVDFSLSDWNLGSSGDLMVLFSQRTGLAFEASLSYYGKQQDFHTTFTASGVWAF